MAMARLEIIATVIIQVKGRTGATDIYSFAFDGTEIVLDGYQRARQGNSQAKMIICKKWNKAGYSNIERPSVPEEVLDQAKKELETRINNAVANMRKHFKFESAIERLPE